MRTTETLVLPAPPSAVFPHVAVLDAYPRWLPLVHTVEPSAPGGADGAGGELGEPAWSVELRARVGPFARSKRLRMARTALEPGRRAVFERAETDGRRHARWALTAEVAAAGDGCELSMHLAYDGNLWTAGLLERVLDEEIRRGRAGLLALVTA